ncbi:MAG: hypothetical protein U0232_00595 [Thermomicrobiales bacterium]
MPRTGATPSPTATASTPTSGATSAPWHTTASRWAGDGTYGPNDEVLRLQAISFITRAFVARGWWSPQPDNPASYPNIPTSAGGRGDLATFVYYAGPIPGTASASGDFPDWTGPATRAWFTLALQQAIDSYWGGTP